MVFEEAGKDAENTKMQLPNFLVVDPGLSPTEAGHSRIYQQFSPRCKRLYVWVIAHSQRLRSSDHDRVINFAKRLRIKRMLE